MEFKKIIKDLLTKAAKADFKFFPHVSSYKHMAFSCYVAPCIAFTLAGIGLSIHFLPFIGLGIGLLKEYLDIKFKGGKFDKFDVWGTLLPFGGIWFALLIFNSQLG